MGYRSGVGIRSFRFISQDLGQKVQTVYTLVSVKVLALGLRSKCTPFVLSNLNLKQKSICGCVDRSCLNLQTLVGKVGRREGERRDVDANVFDSSEAAAAIRIYHFNFGF
jgi:hypothetical protein